MPLALLALTIGAFAIGTTEFVIVGLVPTIAEQLAISLPSAGLLVSIYALGVAIGAPVLTALTGRMPRKQLLLALMALFTAGNLLAWQAPGYETLVLARLLTGLAHGVFFSIGSTIATSLVPKEKAASAIAIIWGFAFALVPVGWSTWITRSLADQAEKAGSIQVAVIQLANTCGAAAGGVALDHLGLTSPLVISGTLMLLTALLVAAKVRAKS